MLHTWNVLAVWHSVVVFKLSEFVMKLHMEDYKLLGSFKRELSLPFSKIGKKCNDIQSNDVLLWIGYLTVKPC